MTQNRSLNTINYCRFFQIQNSNKTSKIIVIYVLLVIPIMSIIYNNNITKQINNKYMTFSDNDGDVINNPGV